ncbi:MAG: hypothetical protein RBR59_09175 [Sulfurimonadaceae bacterium]|jgi:hypothetical protein|nr:hypothetical protein [Sulfurimonadaceae bacterium]
MKNTLATLFLLFSLTGCSHQNAFSKFNMETEEEKSASSQQDTPIFKNQEVAGSFSAVYLNEIKPDIYNGEEYFLIALYLKEKGNLKNLDNYEVKKQELENIDNKNETLELENFVDKEVKGLQIILNSKNPLTIEPLPQELRRYISLDASWNHYYMVVFEQTVENRLSISLHGNDLHTKNLTYTKNEE